MASLKYKIIKNKTQYKQYCDQLEALVSVEIKSKELKDEIDLLTLLIEKWDEEHNSFKTVDPVMLLHSLINDYNMKSKDLADILQVSKGYVSEILNYKKGMSKEVIRKLAGHFKMSQEAFNREYQLKTGENTHLKKPGSAKKDMILA